MNDPTSDRLPTSTFEMEIRYPRLKTTNVGTILEILDLLPSDMILSNGGTDWSVECLFDAIRDGDEADAKEYTIGCTENGRLTISEVTSNGLRNPPAYVQKIED